jgi:hypothetical protein
MGTTPIYAFPYPDPSDLVANYPALGQDLAEDVETVIAALSSGLNHITTGTFSAASSTSINNVFSSTYDDYKILIRYTSGAGAMRMRMRVAGADNTTSNYDTRTVNFFSSTLAGESELNTSIFQVGQGSNSAMSIDVYSPFLSEITGFTSQCFYNATDVNSLTASGALNLTTSFTGFSLLPSTGTITGRVSVYGYEK